MKVIKILGIEKKPKSKKYIIITEDLNYTVSEDMVIKHQLFKEKSFTEDEFKQVIEDILEDEYWGEKTWEKAESKIVKECVAGCLGKEKVSNEDIDYMFSASF